MQTTKRHFIPAAGLHMALPFYDPLLKLIGATEAQRAFVERAQLRAGQRVLEIGCGTGNVTLLAKQSCPGAEVVGLDPDARALTLARAKLDRAGLAARFDQGFADALPYTDGSFQTVLSSFMWHHLSRDLQRASLRELFRVLAPGGSLHLIDFVRDRRRGWPAISAHARAAEEVCASLEQAGFQVQPPNPQPRVLWQSVCHYHGRRAAQPSAAAE